MKKLVRNRLKRILTSVGLLVLCACIVANRPNTIPMTNSIFVSLSGNDGNDGSIEHPLATPQAAFEKIKSGKADSPITIFFREGYYSFNSPIIIDSIVAPGNPITLKAYKNEKVVISGGEKINNKLIKLLSDKEMLARVPKAARNNIIEVDLQQQGINNLSGLVPHGFGKIANAASELFIDGKPMQLARWPNQETLPIGEVFDHGSITRNGEKENRGALFSYSENEPSTWTSNDAWIYGSFSNGYSDDHLAVERIDKDKKTIKLKQASHYGVFSTTDDKGTNPYRKYYFYNVPEELDMPGEYYIDRSSKKLFVWPTAPIKNASLIITLQETPLVVLYNTKNVSFENIEFGYCRGLAVYATGTINTNFTGCNFNAVGTKAISMNDQVVGFKLMKDSKPYLIKQGNNQHFKITHCNFTNTGAGALTISGGDRKTLTPGNNIVSYCNIRDYSRHNKASPPAVIIEGVGNTITHCNISDGSSGAIGFRGNDHVISFNHIRKTAIGFNDIGAVYTGRDPSSTGTVIKNNFFDSITNISGFSVAAVYIDDGGGGINVTGNIFYRCGNPADYGYGAVHINGGHENRFTNNYFIDCYKGFSNTVWDDAKWKKYITSADIQKRIWKDVDVSSDVFRHKYPHLANYVDSNVTTERDNYVANNYIYNVKKFTTGKTSIQSNNNYESANGRELASVSTKNFTLRTVPAVLRNARNWQPIPFDKIGN